MAGVCHFRSHVFGPEPACWQLPLCVVTTWSWRFHQERRACTTSDKHNYIHKHQQLGAHLHAHREMDIKTHTSKLRANVCNYAPDTASQLAFSCRLSENPISYLVCARIHRSYLHIYIQHAFTYSTYVIIWIHIPCWTAMNECINTNMCGKMNTKTNETNNPSCTLFVFYKTNTSSPHMRHIYLYRWERTLHPVDGLPTGYKDATSYHEKSCI